MKVLFIEPVHVNFGGYFRSYNICINLAKKGIRTDLLVAAENKFQFYIRRKQLHKNLYQYELPRFYIHFFINGRLLRGVIALLFGVFRRYDIIHACVPVQLESNIPAFFLRLLGKKVVMDWDDYWEKSNIYGDYRLMKKYIEFCERLSPKYYGNMVVVSQFLYKLSVQRGANNVLKLINGVNVHQFKVHTKNESINKLKLNTNYKYLISFGHTYTHNRAYLLFKTFEAVRKLDPKIKLLFNYNPKLFVEEQNIQNRISRETLNNIIDVGYIKQKDLGIYLAASNATIFLVNDSDIERANFPIRIGSYLNGESIIIINDINSEVNAVLQKYKCAVMATDIDTLAKKVVAVLHNGAKSAVLKRNVRKAKAALNWEVLIVDLINYYEKII